MDQIIRQAEQSKSSRPPPRSFDPHGGSFDPHGGGFDPYAGADPGMDPSFDPYGLLKAQKHLKAKKKRRAVLQVWLMTTYSTLTATHTFLVLQTQISEEFSKIFVCRAFETESW